MALIVLEREVLELEIEDRLRGRIDLHARQGKRLARQLHLSPYHVIEREMLGIERMHEISRLEAANLGDHQREQRVRRDVERNAEKNIGAALVELARELAACDVELEKRVARRQRHFL